MKRRRLRAPSTRERGSTRAFAEFFNVFVDGVTRLIRPGVTVLLIGGVFGWWPVETKTVQTSR